MRSSSRRSTAALAVACLALFVSLGGGAYAALSIGSAQIRNNSIRSVDVKDRSLRGFDLRKNTLDGNEVREARLGQVPDAAKLAGRLPGAFLSSRIRVATSQAAPVPGPAGGFPSEVTASCNADERAIGGGGGWFIPNFQDNNVTTSLDAPVTASTPVPAGGGSDDLTGWKVNGRNFSGTQRALRAYAICVPKTP